MGSRTAQTFRHVRAYTLCQLEACFGASLPAHLFPKAPKKENSRDRHYTRLRTFWCMVWQGFNPDAAGREVVRQLQALFRLEGGPRLSPEDGAYCRAKGRLPLTSFPAALTASAQSADDQAPPTPFLQGRRVRVVDGSALTLPDTPKNRRAYPPLQCADKPSFPMMRIVVLFSLLSGAITAVAQGSLGISELPLFHALMSHLLAGDIVLGDRGFGSYVMLALLQYSCHVDFIGRTTRSVDGRRRLRRLGRNDWLLCWHKPAKASPWLGALLWANLPAQLTVRAVKGRCSHKGFRVRQVTLVTTLLDPKLYPAQDLLRAYLRRWQLEMCLDDLKTTLKMDLLRSRSPAMLQKELYTKLVAHNLVRLTLAQAATEKEVPLERLSFKGTLDALRQFTHALARARTKKKRQELWADLLGQLASDLVPWRPDRREPRAVKRKKNKYPRLNKPRRQFRDHLKRHTRRKLARLRKLGLM
jgi:hypothetical protein